MSAARNRGAVSSARSTSSVATLALVLTVLALWVAPAARAADEALSPADENGRFVYLIEFAEPGAVHRTPRAARARFDPTTAAAQNAIAQIQAEQAGRLDAIGRLLGAAPEVTHRFLMTHSGVAARLTEQEAMLVRTVPFVKSVERERLYELDTYRGPQFIGADTIWDGTNVPGGVGTKGEGMIIATLDTGIPPTTHPSFADDPACGFGVGPTPSKVLSFLDCATTDITGLCNGPSPLDTNGHGSHTSSTSGGNAVTTGAVPPPLLNISGVAPCAHMRSYKVCPTNSCPGANIQAGMDSVLLHGDADVMNFSISGGTSPWVDNDRKKLDLVDAGVFVAASAGNTSGTIPDPVGQVNHRGPWVLSVAASTHDGSGGLISASGPGTPPGNTQNLAATRGSASPVSPVVNDMPIKHYTGQDPTMEGCTPGEDGVPGGANPFPAGFFDDAAALIHRGTCAFTKKITNAFNAGADFVVIRNNQATALSMSTPGQPAVPAYSIEQAPGNALVAFVDANSNATFDFVPKGDTLAGFSFRGPTPSPLEHLTKPDITGPGVSIYAGVPTTVDATGYANLSGTSMSGPHLAGAATLVRDVHPTWTPPEVKSAIMMTASNANGTKEDGVTPWNIDDVGSGRVDLTKAARAGFVLHETFANFLAADPAMAGDVRTLNLPAVRNVSCTPSCSWTRTVRNTLGTASSWTAVGNPNVPGDFGVDIIPSTFSFTGGLGETQVITIVAAPQTALAGVSFGGVVFTETGSQSPSLRMTVAIQGTGTANLFNDGFESGNVTPWSDCAECP
jgi:subtilisin family serine protease